MPVNLQYILIIIMITCQGGMIPQTGGDKRCGGKAYLVFSFSCQYVQYSPKVQNLT